MKPIFEHTMLYESEEVVPSSSSSSTIKREGSRIIEINDSRALINIQKIPATATGWEYTRLNPPNSTINRIGGEETSFRVFPVQHEK